jgi:hypothetical protein
MLDMNMTQPELTIVSYREQHRHDPLACGDVKQAPPRSKKVKFMPDKVSDAELEATAKRQATTPVEANNEEGTQAESDAQAEAPLGSLEEPPRDLGQSTHILRGELEAGGEAEAAAAADAQEEEVVHQQRERETGLEAEDQVDSELAHVAHSTKR